MEHIQSALADSQRLDIDTCQQQPHQPRIAHSSSMRQRRESVFIWNVPVDPAGPEKHSEYVLVSGFDSID